MTNQLKAKQIICTSGEVQLPIVVGEELAYAHGNTLYWTDKVRRILEVAADYIRVETTSYYYIIEKEDVIRGRMGLAA